jgi:hypothetical protein
MPRPMTPLTRPAIRNAMAAMSMAFSDCERRD